MQDSVYIIGGGPSLRGFDFGLLAGEDVIGVNDSIFLPELNIVAGVFKDKVLFDYYRDRWDEVTARFPVYTYTAFDHYDKFQIMKTPSRWDIGNIKDPQSLPFYRSSGNCAVGLAARMGYKTIFLLGFDGYAKDGKTHWHDHVHMPQTQHTYDCFCAAGERAKNDALKFWPDVKMYNLHPDDKEPSHIPCWEKAPFSKRGELVGKENTQRNIVTWVYKTGGDFDGGNAETMIERQKAGILKHLNPSVKPPEFMVITNADVQIEGVKTVKMKYDFKGWYSKFELFRTDLAEYDDRIIYFDLDTDIYGDISPLMNLYTGAVNMISDLYKPELLASGVMVFGAGRFEHLLNMYKAKAYMIDDRVTDQVYIRTWAGLGRGAEKPRSIQEQIPDLIYSYKRDCLQQGPKEVRPEEPRKPEECPVLCYHGKPRPWSL